LVCVFFEGFELGSAPGRNGKNHEGVDPGTAIPEPEVGDKLRDRVDGLVYKYRILGHLQASLDPLAEEKPTVPALSLAELGLGDVPLDTVVSCSSFRNGEKMPLGKLFDELNRAYGNTVAVEFMHIQNEKVRTWVRDRIENRSLQPGPDEVITEYNKKELLVIWNLDQMFWK